MKYLILLLILPLLCLSSCGHKESDNYYEARENMVEKQLKVYGIEDETVLAVMKKVKRHLFVPENMLDKAYNDYPLPIGEGQTISQPYIVALMTEVLKLKQGDKVLEIGTGSGYQAAVLSEITDHVYSIEINESLSEFAGSNLKSAGYENILLMHGDGYYGWDEYAPFDAVIITCAANHIPPPLLDQLTEGGRLVIPLGDPTYYQTLTLVEKIGEDYTVTHIADVRFVPMTGTAEINP